jgi:ligand-binding sensor domain-containing protein
MKARLVLIIILLFGVNSFAQSPYFRKHTLPLEYKSAQISTMIHATNHFLWFGTSVGVIRFNGEQYKQFTEFPDKDNTVSALFEDSKGTLWIGYKNGRIGTLSDETFQPTDSAKFPKVPVTGFAEDSTGNIWAATYGEGIWIIGNDQFRNIDTSDGLSDNFVYTIAGDNTNKIVAGTDHGLSICTIRAGKIFVANMGSSAGIRDNIITSLTFDSRKRLWTGSESAGVAYYDSARSTFVYPFDSWPYGRITSIIPASETVWVGTAMNGVIEASEKGEFVNIVNRDDQSLPLRITDLERDLEGNIWVASGSGTVHSAHPLFSFIHNYDGKETGNIQALLYSENGQIIFSTSDGVFSIRPHANTISPELLKIPQLRNAQVISLYEDATGHIWFGTFDKGAYRYHPGTGKVTLYSEDDGLVNNNILSIAGTNDGIWFATLGGVSHCVLHPNITDLQFTNYTTESGLGSNYIYKIFIDNKQRVWFATDGKGVSVMEKGKFRNYALNEGARSIIYSVTEDISGQIWVSTSNNGIYRFEGNSFKAFTPRNGLRDLAISSIIGAKNGSILIVSRQGIDVLDPKSGSVFYHGQEFGISDIDPNLNAYTQDKDDNIWLGTQNGIIKYNTNIPPMQQWPVTRINEMQVFLTRADTSRRVLPSNKNHISFDYIGFWYHDPAEVSYKLKLEGYDREWIRSKNNFITYPNLPPGEYTFMVQSSATNDFQGAQTQTFKFSIAPPFYNTIWFYTLAICSLLGISYWFMRNRENRLKERERIEKEKIQFQFETLKNQVNPHFLFNSFNTLIGVIEEDRDTAVEYVLKLSDFYRDILVNREKEVIALRTEVEMLGNYYFLQMKRYKDNFLLRVDVPADKNNYSIPPLTLQLLVENAVKHNAITRDKPLVVDVYVEGDSLVVKNNLQRKAVREPSTGLGLSNIIARFKLLTSQPVIIEETATHFNVRVPLIKPEP